MGIRYLGSKARVIDAIAQLIGKPVAKAERFIDAFSGTGVVASAAADLGWNVHINDHMRCARLLSTARMLAKSDVPFSEFGGYSGAIDRLNKAEPASGFLWREYSPASSKRAPRPRQYFTEKNAAQMDGVRDLIREWRTARTITIKEEGLLLADLLEAASAIANTAGTFGCFLSGWSSTALRPFRLRARSLRAKPVLFTEGELDVFSVSADLKDTVYLDPPYTKRQYAAYYHVLETLAHGDEPKVSGVTGLRPWRDKASLFCYKRHALPSMLKLIRGIRANRVLISYSTEGHIDLEELTRGLREYGTVETHQISKIPRYQPTGSTQKYVDEFVVEFQRE
ncbi:MAG: DNA adenine methylase [Caldilineaceae bacterium]|nr:DNA adenine methylase [Caldilineaceae bacterium]